MHCSFLSSYSLISRIRSSRFLHEHATDLFHDIFDCEPSDPRLKKKPIRSSDYSIQETDFLKFYFKLNCYFEKCFRQGEDCSQHTLKELHKTTIDLARIMAELAAARSELMDKATEQHHIEKEETRIKVSHQIQTLTLRSAEGWPRSASPFRRVSYPMQACLRRRPIP